MATKTKRGSSAKRGGGARRERPAPGGHRGFAFKKTYGQHVLRNPQVVESIIDKANVRGTDTALEVGPGTGNLTVKLLDAAKRVVAVELDARMVVEVTKRVQARGQQAARRLEVVHGDFLRSELPYFDVCVANVPYQISSPLVFKLLAHRPAFRCAVLMFQREFALRLVAQPGDSLFCRLAVNVQMLAKVEHVLKVGRNNFRPPPKVDSSVVRIEPRHPPPPINFCEWDGMLRLCFGRKNKTLGSIFRQNNVLRLLRSNASVAAAQSGAAVAGAGVERLAAEDAMTDAADDHGEGDVDVDVEDGGGGDGDGLDAVKQDVAEVLQQCGMACARAAKTSIDDFLRLLHAFNARSYHFA